MTCPTCIKDLIELPLDCQICPDGHGVLLTANQLYEKNDALVRAVDQRDAMSPQAAYRQYPISCPSCGNEMSVVNYCNSGVMIDSCTQLGCHSRWLDGDELIRIKNRKLQIRPEDALFLSELEMKTKKLRNLCATDNNPKLPSMTRSLLANSNTSLYGVTLVFSRLIRANIESPFIRYVTLFVLLAMVVLAYISWLNFN